MKNGPLIFLGGLVAMVSCWCGLVVAPVLGLGSLAANVDGTTGDIYPVDRAGAAKQGAQLYRSLGCGECHTRHTTQESLLYGTRITEVAADKEAVMATLLKLRTDWTEKEASDALGTPPPIQVLASVDEFSAARAVDLLKATESKAEMTVHNSGTDLARGWGKRQSVSRDYIYDADILLGSRRIGPDLANIGSRAPENHVGEMNLYAPATNLVERLEERRQWHLRRLYSPVSTLEGAKCPSYKFLFDLTDEAPHGPNAAVTLPEKFAAPVGKFVVPKIEAAQLVAWLLAQSADISLPEAPVHKPDAPVRKDPKTEADAAADQSK